MATDTYGIPQCAAPLMGLALLVSCSLFCLGCGSTDLLVKGPYMRGVDQYDAGDSRGAISEYQIALADNPEDHRIHYNLGLCFHDLFMKTDEGDDQRGAYLKKASDFYARSASLTESKAKAQVASAKLLWDAGDHDEAVTLLSGIVGDDGTGEAMPAWTLGTMYLTDNRHEDAATAFSASLSADQQYLPALTAMADLRLGQGRWDEAEVFTKKGLKKSPHDVTLLIFDARIAQARIKGAPQEEQADLWRECLVRWRLAEGMVPTDWEVLFGIGNCAEALGQTQLAVRYYWFCRDNASDIALQSRGLNSAAFKADLKRRLLDLYPLLPASE